jgi:thiosulfate dehydrogenase [quinone] large subunit
VFLWAFFVKLLGLGFSTCRDLKTDTVSLICSKAWINDGSPTLGFLKFGTKGPLADIYQSLAGHTWVDWLFMMGLFLIGITLILGVAMKLAVFSGSLLLLMMWSASLLPANNPLIDDHIVYILALFALLATNNNQAWGLNNWWQKQAIVKKYSLLQ